MEASSQYLGMFIIYGSHWVEVTEAKNGIHDHNHVYTFMDCLGNSVSLTFSF